MLSQTGIQTALERIGLLVLQHLNEAGRSVDHGDLAALLEHRGPLPPEFKRGYHSKALAELPDDIVYLRRSPRVLAIAPPLVQGLLQPFTAESRGLIHRDGDLSLSEAPDPPEAKCLEP